jgi:hypothetical protein
MLSDQDIIRQLRAIRYSSTRERNARRLPSVNALAKAAGLARPYLFEITNTGRLGTVARAKLTRALTSQQE